MSGSGGNIVVLTEGKPWKCILKFAVPLFVGSLLQQFYYTVDTMMVGRFVGERALSGVGTCGVLTNLLIGQFLPAISIKIWQWILGSITVLSWMCHQFLPLSAVVVARWASIVGSGWLIVMIYAVFSVAVVNSYPKK